MHDQCSQCIVHGGRVTAKRYGFGHIGRQLCVNWINFRIGCFAENGRQKKRRRPDEKFPACRGKRKSADEPIPINRVLCQEFSDLVDSWIF